MITYYHLADMKKDLRSQSMSYISAAEHATVLYLTIQQLIRIGHMYQYSFELFTKVFKSSIENSNKSNNIEKRLRYLKVYCFMISNYFLMQYQFSGSSNIQLILSNQLFFTKRGFSDFCLFTVLQIDD